MEESEEEEVPHEYKSLMSQPSNSYVSLEPAGLKRKTSEIHVVISGTSSKEPATLSHGTGTRSTRRNKKSRGKLGSRTSYEEPLDATLRM